MPFRGHMDTAFAEAEAAFSRGEVPIGAAIADANGDLIAAAGNRIRQHHDPTAHAEILAIRQACAEHGSEFLTGFSLYVTLEPCPMCASAISQARIRRLYYGASNPKSGGVEFGPRIFAHEECLHRPEIYSAIGEQRAAQLMQRFFETLR
ncbi:MAG: nucleoside deaminase [Rhodobacteraceae bacterium]|nr:nucleoside deaminase [Paracoccaceae bacterium]